MTKEIKNYSDITVGRSITMNFEENDSLNSLLEESEKRVYAIAIERCKRNQSTCAKALGVSRGTLRTKLRQYFGNEYFRDII